MAKDSAHRPIRVAPPLGVRWPAGLAALRQLQGADPIGSISFSKVNDPKGIRTPVLREGDRHLSISKASDPKILGLV